jgi:hypothetical protein
MAPARPKETAINSPKAYDKRTDDQRKDAEKTADQYGGIPLHTEKKIFQGHFSDQLDAHHGKEKKQSNPEQGPIPRKNKKKRCI